MTDTWQPDAAYLSAALDRAGRDGSLDAPVESESLHGGRTGAQVFRLVSGMRRYALKLVPEESWRGEGMDCPDGGEARLWRSGILAGLPDRLRWPIVDVSPGEADPRHRILMEDVGDGFRDRGQFSHDDTRNLFLKLAEMHAGSLGSDRLHHPSLPSVVGATRVLTLPVLHAAGRRASTAPWVASVLADFQVLEAFLPIFLESLGPTRSEDWLDVVADDFWIDRMGELTPTLLHGDLRRANIAFEEDGIALIDWEFASRGPPGSDLQWHCLLHYWGYPPDGTAPGDPCDEMFDAHAAAFKAIAKRTVDREELSEGWKLGWLRAVSMLGYVLVDRLYPDGGTEEMRREVSQLCRRAVERAVDFRASLG